MKRTLLLLLLSTSLLQSYAKHEFFDRKTTRVEKQRKNIPFALQKSPVSLANNITIATLEKTSSWDNIQQNWIPGNSYKENYQNDLLIAAYEMNYTQTDTFTIINYIYFPDKKIQQITYNYQVSPGLILPSNRQTFTYTNNDLRIIVVGEQYDAQTQTWTNEYRTTYDFNSKGMQIGVKQEGYNNNAWEIFYANKTDIEYLRPNSNKILFISDSTYSNNTSSFELTNKELRTYNVNEELIDIQYSTLYQGLGMITTHIDSVYYTNGVVSLIDQYVLDSSGLALLKSRRISNIRWVNFDPNTDVYYNNSDAYTISNWEQNAWQFSLRASASYPDSYGSSIYTDERYVNNAWQNSIRYNNINDNKKNAIENSSEEFNMLTNTWELSNGGRYTHQYNMSNLITETIQESYDGMITQWLKTEKYEYSDFVTIALGINTKEKTIEAKLYPNPCTNGRVSINVKMEAASELRIKITDLKGSVVYTDKKDLGKGLNTVEFSGLQQGLYMVELSTDFGVTSVKLMVK